jgi:2',3'-cyclic-nucleotide 2'-phosphodiesterase
LPVLVARHGIDCVIANAENAAAGSGLTDQLYQKIVRSGVNLITMGDHIYRRKEIYPVLAKETNIVKPANFPAGAPGREYAVHQTAKGESVAVISVLGRLFMKPLVDDPFVALERVLAGLPTAVKIIVVDVHAEATSEKVAIGWHLDGRVSLVFGTHTHVPTADERVLPKGTAYVTDLGMTGPYDSVLGRDKERVLGSMMTAVPSAFDVALHDPRLYGVVVSVESTTGLARSIERVRFDGVEQ